MLVAILVAGPFKRGAFKARSRRQCTGKDVLRKLLWVRHSLFGISALVPLWQALVTGEREFAQVTHMHTPNLLADYDQLRGLVYKIGIACTLQLAGYDTLWLQVEEEKAALMERKRREQVFTALYLQILPLNDLLLLEQNVHTNPAHLFPMFFSLPILAAKILMLLVSEACFLAWAQEEAKRKQDELEKILAENRRKVRLWELLWIDLSNQIICVMQKCCHLSCCASYLTSFAGSESGIVASEILRGILGCNASYGPGWNTLLMTPLPPLWSVQKLDVHVFTSQRHRIFLPFMVCLALHFSWSNLLAPAPHVACSSPCRWFLLTSHNRGSNIGNCARCCVHLSSRFRPSPTVVVRKDSDATINGGVSLNRDGGGLYEVA